MNGVDKTPVSAGNPATNPRQDEIGKPDVNRARGKNNDGIKYADRGKIGGGSSGGSLGIPDYQRERNENLNREQCRKESDRSIFLGRGSDLPVNVGGNRHGQKHEDNNWKRGQSIATGSNRNIGDDRKNWNFGRGKQRQDREVNWQQQQHQQQQGRQQYDRKYDRTNKGINRRQKSECRDSRGGSVDGKISKGAPSMTVIVHRVDLLDGYIATGCDTKEKLTCLERTSTLGEMEGSCGGYGCSGGKKFGSTTYNSRPLSQAFSQGDQLMPDHRREMGVAPIAPYFFSFDPASLKPNQRLERKESIYVDAVEVHVDDSLEDVITPKRYGNFSGKKNWDGDNSGNTRENIGKKYEDSFVDAIEGGDCPALDGFFDSFAPSATVVRASKSGLSQNESGRLVNKSNKVDNALQVAVVYAPPSSINVKRCSAMEDLSRDRHILNPFPPKVVHDKYWAQRRRLFSRFDDGIQLDGEGWYSVTPEAIADHVARRMGDIASTMVETGINGLDGIVILDAFCGCGGNAIAFGKLSPFFVSLVVCVDLDLDKIRMAAHNAAIYGIDPSKILFIHANTLLVLDKCYKEGDLIMKNNCAESPTVTPSAVREKCEGYVIGGTDLLPPHIHAVFIDPPWGGVDYGNLGKGGYDLEKNMKIQYEPETLIEAKSQSGKQETTSAFVDGVNLLGMAASATKTKCVVYDVPRNTNKVSMGRAALKAGYHGNIKMEEYFLNGRLKTTTTYVGHDYSNEEYQRGQG